MSVHETQRQSSFVDTNIWPYAFIEGDNPQKSASAKLLIEASSTVIVSIQVINEMWPATEAPWRSFGD